MCENFSHNTGITCKSQHSILTCHGQWAIVITSWFMAVVTWCPYYENLHKVYRKWKAFLSRSKKSQSLEGPDEEEGGKAGPKEEVSVDRCGPVGRDLDIG